MINNKSVAMLSFLVGGILSYLLFNEQSLTGNSKRDEINENRKSPTMDFLTDPAGVNPPDKKIRDSNQKPAQTKIVDQLERMALTNPELVSRLYIRLFDNDFTPILGDWKLLGIDQDSAAIVSEDLKNIFKEVKNWEVKNFSIIDQSENQVKISIPKLKPEEASNLVSQIQDSFEKLVGPQLSKQFTRNFITNHSAIAAGLDGKDRVVTITTASEISLKSLNRKYEIKTQTLYQGTNLSDALKNLESYSQDNGIELVVSIPESWKHLFGNSD